MVFWFIVYYHKLIKQAITPIPVQKRSMPTIILVIKQWFCNDVYKQIVYTIRI